MKSFIQNAFVAITVTLASIASLAAEFQINISGVVSKPASASSLFGLTDSTPVPFELSFVVDTNLGAVQVIPANTIVNTDEAPIYHYSFATPMTFVPKSAIKNLGLTIGTYNWLTQNLYEQILGNVGQYGALIQGTLTNGSVTKANLYINNGLGELLTSTFSCISGSCNLSSVGLAYDYTTDSGAIVQNMSATVTEIIPNTTTEQKLTNLEQLITSTDATKATGIVLGSQIKLAQKALEKGNTQLLKQSLETFIRLADVQSGKSISATDAEALKEKAQATLDSLI